MKKILLLGSTGSIGSTSLEIIRADFQQNNLKNFKITGLSAYSNIKLLIKQIEEFNPEFVCVGSYENYKILKEKYPNLKLFYGNEGLKDIASYCDYDIIITAVSGSIGIDPTIEAIKREKIIALANKETLVEAGVYIKNLLKKYKNAKIIPVDSEHSAIFQAIASNRHCDIKRLIITASGGPFRDKTLQDLKNVSLADTLKHPNWSMGRKITVDSATLVNKGLEIIEAHTLFDIQAQNIDTIIHRESIIHSMVEYIDGSIIAQMGVPSMKTPILYALTYPERKNNKSIDFLDFTKLKSLSFQEIKRDIFKGIDFAYYALEASHTMPVVFNAANEVAVELFLKEKIKFLDIYKVIETEMEAHNIIKLDTNVLDKIKYVDTEVRNKVREKWER